MLQFVKTLGGATSAEVTEANRKHREDADTLDGGTRRTTRSSMKQDTDEGDGDGSMLDALRADRKGAFDRSKRVSQFSSVGRR